MHIDVIVPGEPIFGGELVRRIAHHLIETRTINDPLTGEDRDGCWRSRSAHTDHFHRSIAYIELGGDVAVGSNCAGGSLLDPGNVDVHIGRLAAGGIAHQDPGLHIIGIELVHPGVPVIGRELVETACPSLH